jgi:nucleoside-diphosphate-sugar epimerase
VRDGKTRSIWAIWKRNAIGATRRSMWKPSGGCCSSADDYVLGTGEAHSVREFVEEAFQYAGLDWRKHVKMSERYLRPLEVDVLIADPKKARTKLGWEPRVGFRDLVAIMVDADLEAAGVTPPGRGKAILEEKIGHWNQWEKSVTRVVQAIAGQASQH